MTRWTILCLLAATSARADGDRCAAGVALAKKGDLPRAALYLEDCDDEEATRARADVSKKLEASQLSMMAISTTPSGLTAETDALPGEKLVTPATVWAKAGTYKITVTRDGTPVTVEKTLDAHSRSTVLVPAPPARKPARNGAVSFDEEPEQQQGAPPPVKHSTMLPKQYVRQAPAGPEIEDPFATRTNSDVPWRIGVRIAGGVFDRSGAAAQAGFGAALIAGRRLDGPVMLATRLDWTHAALDTIGANAGIGAVALETRSLVLSVDAAMRGEVHVQDKLDAMAVSRAGLGGAVAVDVAWLGLPLAGALRYQQGFTELVPGARERALLVELGYDWR